MPGRGYRRVATAVRQPANGIKTGMRVPGTLVFDRAAGAATPDELVGPQKLEPDVGRALVRAPTSGESFDQKQSAAADVVRSSGADLVLETAAFVDDFAASDPLVEFKSEDDLATPVHKALLTSFDITNSKSLSRSRPTLPR